MRQFSACDVLAQLGGLPVENIIGTPVNNGPVTYITGVAETAPLMELGFFLRTAEGNTLDKITEEWSTSKGMDRVPLCEILGVLAPELTVLIPVACPPASCLLDVVTANKTYFEERIIGIPASYEEDDFSKEVGSP